MQRKSKQFTEWNIQTAPSWNHRQEGRRQFRTTYSVLSIKVSLRLAYDKKKENQWKTLGNKENEKSHAKAQVCSPSNFPMTWRMGPIFAKKK